MAKITTQSVFMLLQDLMVRINQEQIVDIVSLLLKYRKCLTYSVACNSCSRCSGYENKESNWEERKDLESTEKRNAKQHTVICLYLISKMFLLLSMWIKLFREVLYFPHWKIQYLSHGDTDAVEELNGKEVYKNYDI